MGSIPTSGPKATISAANKGVQQGDPLGPLFFCLAWQRVVRQLPPELVFNTWYLDDGHLVGTWAQLEAALAIIQTEGARLGVSLNTKKCQAWGPGVPRTTLPASERLTAPSADIHKLGRYPSSAMGGWSWSQGVGLAGGVPRIVHLQTREATRGGGLHVAGLPHSDGAWRCAGATCLASFLLGCLPSPLLPTGCGLPSIADRGGEGLVLHSPHHG